ncbi:hypothetical protein F5Y16DRAFT_371072 [Xylariaceae sp. FL0255]|nr:hypothetical protein F5Y16DRAFT_371072 [Xylariaceae sp. FL0255]
MGERPHLPSSCPNFVMTELKGTFLLTGANGGLGAAITSQIESKAPFNEYYCI